MIKITKKSKKLIKDTFKLYKKINKIQTFIREKTIIHIYPTEDTDKKCSLEGYFDSLLFTARIYFCESKTFFETKYKDNINIELYSKIQIFKDESTMIIINNLPFKIIISSNTIDIIQ